MAWLGRMGLQRKRAGTLIEGPWSYRIGSFVFVTPIYTVILLSIGFASGQFAFFANVARRMWCRILPGIVAKPAKKAADDDDLDLFGDSDEEAPAPSDAKAARAAAAAAAKEAAEKKKKKEKPPAKSLVTLVVKPWEADTDLDELFKLITATEKEGLVWGTACEKEPVAYVIIFAKFLDR